MSYRYNLIVRKRGGGERVIPWDKIIIDKTTDHGEHADLYEKMPHEGRRYIPRHIIIRKEFYSGVSLK